jgi:hypothetical protein
MAARKTVQRRQASGRGTRAARGKRPTRAAQAPHQAAVQRFLERLTNALTAGDGEGAAACFESPALMVMADPRHGGNQVLQDRATVAKFFGQAPQQYHAKGVQWTFPDVERLEWVADGLALVRVRFPYIDADGNDLGDGETSVYVVRKTGPDLAICTALALGVDSER